eukprot:803044-Pelagomonas_calceolata.AAC.2
MKFEGDKLAQRGVLAFMRTCLEYDPSPARCLQGLASESPKLILIVQHCKGMAIGKHITP